MKPDTDDPRAESARRAYSLKQTAEVLNVSLHTIERLCKSGAIHSVLVSPRRRIVPATEIDRILADKTVTPALDYPTEPVAA
jgi:predicted site-specific integrase-resolvase